MAYRSFSCLQTGIRINSCCLSMGSMLKPEAPRFFSSFRRFTAAVQNGRIGSKIRKMNRPSVIRARGHMVSLYPYRHIPNLHTGVEASCMEIFCRKILQDFSRLHSRFLLHPVHTPALRPCGSASALLACPTEAPWEIPAYQRNCSRS